MSFPPARRGLLWACGLGALLRLPALRYGVISDDEAIYDATARVLVRGGVMYRDVVDHKPPGLAYTYALAQWLAGGGGARSMALTHLLGLAFVIGTCAALYAIAKRTLAPGLWSLPPLLYAVISACKQPVDALAVNGELLMNLPAALCALCAIAAGARAAGGPRLRAILLDVLAGALGAGAALYKWQAAVVLFALPALWLLDVRPVRVGTLLERGVASVLGALGPLLLCAAFFSSRGALPEALAWGLGFNRSYVAEGSSPLWALQRFGLQLAGVVLPGALLYGAGLLTLLRLLRSGASEVTAARAFLATWALFCIASVFLGLRFFGHYFLQPELPLSLLAAGPVQRLWSLRPRLAVAALAAPALVFFFLAAAPAVSQPLFNARDPDFAAIGRAAAARTGPAETIWVWGNVPQLYFAAGRAPGVRFTFCNYLTGLSPGTPSEYDDALDPAAHAVGRAWTLALADLENNRPALVLDTAAAGLKSYGKFPVSRFPALAKALAAHYRRDGEVDGVVLYRRVD